MPVSDLLTESRRETNRRFRRDAVLAAAQRVFAEAGLDGATVRAIAQEAGYTAGAVYSYYPTKEAIYADILSHSLATLKDSVVTAIDGEAGPEARLRAAITAFFDYYRLSPRELELGLYLFRGLRPMGLGHELDRQLNSRLIAVLQKIAATIAQFAKLDAVDAQRETVAVVSHVMGVLLMANTGRLKVLDSNPEDLVAHYVGHLAERLREAR